MEDHLCDVNAAWHILGKSTGRTPASQSCVVIKLRYIVLHFLGGRGVQEQQCPYDYFLFTLGELLDKESRRRAISSVLVSVGAYDHDFRSTRRLEEDLVAFSDVPVELALDLGRGIEMTFDICFRRFWSGADASFDEGVGGGGGFGGVPALSDAVKEVAVMRYERGGDVREESCMICLEEFDVGEEVTRMPCMHAFHGGCLTRWLESSHLCPLCRHAIPASADP